MSKMFINYATYIVLILVLAAPGNAHEIVLKDGKIIKTRSCWEENGAIKYERYGGILTIEKKLVEEVIYSEEEPVVSPVKKKFGTILEQQEKLRKERTRSLASDEIFRLCKPAVVIIKCGGAEGTGFFISDDGYILTNYHVIRSHSSIEVHLSSDEVYIANMISSTEKPDAALLKIDRNNMPYLALEKNTIPEEIIGKEVFAIGNPGGLQFSITRGIISQIRTMDDVKYIQTDTPLNPGNSGGPLINKLGNVVGMNTLKRAYSTGLNFAISSDSLFTWVEQYSKFGIVHYAKPSQNSDDEPPRPSQEGPGIFIIPVPGPSW
ncbi:S1C family serine protease [Desulfonema magnum]|uniref:Peptidase domain-containing protein n=1 Tax=Desulfonema magnum TaxID=45655 RepID=A0A975GKN4_9BACT|nr:S1C family serine protease [Desulfonema magnum]QTA84911.1 Peptidase domain-containing protein [Desulfonema magnum]